MTYPEHPALECDIVMKGGITSGVIYPRAVCKLAKTYRLRSVGGSSAGAIAAAGAAAAEFGRAAGGFELLEALPHDITADSPAGGSVLFRLFQPTKQSYPLYRVFIAGMGKPAKTLSTLLALLSSFRLWALAGAVIGVGLIVVSLFGCGPAVFAGVVGGLIVTVLGTVLGAGWGAVRNIAGVAGSMFGLCTGMPGAGANGAAALTPFLHDKFQAMAGRSGGDVLTFGDLAAQGIELRVMTTNLTRRQPMAMPWTNQEYFFEPAEMRGLFPEDVVTWMEQNPPQTRPDGKELSAADRRSRDLLRAQAGSKRPWPAPDDVPVIVATRMSLSFPLLITAVPVYAVDYSLEANKAASGAGAQWLAAHPDRLAAEGAAEIDLQPQFSANWFSDGGICANLPVHFFDAPLPTRPTFAIDLQEFPPDKAKSEEQSENCYLPIRNQDGLLRPWTLLSTPAGAGISGVKALGAFLFQIVNTARGWLDAAQLVMPGYRDRVITIYHDDTEGGMNLSMPKDVVAGLADRGEAAADLLVEKFTGSPDGKPEDWGWNNQRWVRFRTATAGFNVWMTSFQTKYRTDVAGAAPYADLAGPDADAALPSYRFRSAGDRAAANDLTAGLLALTSTWGAPTPFSDSAPRPRPQLRLTPDDGVASSVAERASGKPTEDLNPLI
jgi:predicted acylesterase/phospholipase RssA